MSCVVYIVRELASFTRLSELKDVSAGPAGRKTFVQVNISSGETLPNVLEKL